MPRRTTIGLADKPELAEFLGQPPAESSAPAAPPPDPAEPPAQGAPAPVDAAPPPDDPDAPPKGERLSTSWAAVKRARKEQRQREEEFAARHRRLVDEMQQIETMRSDLEKRIAGLDAREKAAIGDPLTWLQERGVAARALVEAAAKEPADAAERHQRSRENADLRELVQQLTAKVEQLTQASEKRQTEATEREELAEIAHILENPAEYEIEADGIQWWGAEIVAKALHDVYRASGRKLDLRAEIASANRFYRGRMARAGPPGKPHASPGNGGSPARGTGAETTAEPAEQSAPPALPNASARRPGPTVKRTKAERLKEAINLLEVR